MTKSATVSQYIKKVNRRDQYHEILKAWAEFYNIPLKRAIRRLHYTHNDTLETIAGEVFENQISRQAVHTEYVMEETK